MSLDNFSSVYDLLQHNARTRAAAPAAISAEQSLSHKAFLDRVDQLASGLTASGIEKGDRVCILAQNSIEYLELYGACAKTGVIAYPINWRLTASEVQGVIKLADPQMLVVGVGHLEQLGDLDPSGMRVRATIGEGSIEGFTPLRDLYHSEISLPVEIQDDDPFVIISTAATEGVPRGAILTHKNILSASVEFVTAVGLTSADRYLVALPLFHITALGLAFGTTLSGGANVVLDAFDPGLAVKLMDEHQVTLVAVFPPVLSMLLDAREQAGAHWDSLKYVFGLDAPDTIKRLLSETKAQFWTGFGQSETTGAVTLVRVDQKPGSAGRPLPRAQIRLVDATGEDVPVGEAGEIAVRGPMVFSGYWRDPDATAFAARHGWHHTGDVGKFDAEGYLFYVGRKPEKELIKSGGENVYPAEVENVIQEMPEVAGVAVIGVADEKWGEAVKAVVELVAGQSLDATQISDAVAARIASFKKPRYVDFVDKLPRTDDGAVDRDAVKAAHG